MAETMRVPLTCPHCGVQQTLLLCGDVHLIFCDAEQGGCEEPFVANVEIVTTVKVQIGTITYPQQQ